MSQQNYCQATMLRLILLATLLGIVLAAPVDKPLNESSSDASSWFYPLSMFFGGSATTKLPTVKHSTIDDDSISTAFMQENSSSSSVVFEAFGNVTRDGLVRIYLETDRQMRYWRLMAIMGVLSWLENLAGYNGSFSESMKDAALDGGNDPSLMAASLEGARQMAQMMSATVQNRFGQLVG